MATKLIIVEGLPGSGKSTTARLVYENLISHGVNAVIYSEGDYNHPADYESVAYFNYEEFCALKQNHPRRSEMLDNMKLEQFEGYLLPFRKAVEERQLSYDESVFHDIAKKDIYELPIEVHRRLILDRWDSFVKNHSEGDTVFVFECCFIQNPITVSMIKNNSAKDVTMRHIKSLEEIIVSLEPVLIYVKQEDIGKSFAKAIKERPKSWFEGFKDYYTNQGYGLYNKLTDMDGLLQILEARGSLELDVYESLEISKYVIDNSEFDLVMLKDKVNAIIENHGGKLENISVRCRCHR